MEKSPMKLFFTKSLRAHEYAFAVKVGNEAAYASQKGEVWVTSKDSCDYSSEKDVTPKIQKINLLKKWLCINKKIRKLQEFMLSIGLVSSFRLLQLVWVF